MSSNVRPSPGRHLTGRVENHQTMTGNLIQILIGNTVVGRCQNITSRESFGTEPIYELGSMLPAELVPLQWRGSLTVDKYRLIKEAFESLPVKFGEDVLKQTLFDVVIVNKRDNSIIEKFRGCVQSDISGSYPANRPSTQNVTFFYMEHLTGTQVQNASRVQ